SSQKLHSGFQVFQAQPCFDPALIKEGLGLKNLETRVELLGGTHEVHTQPGKGLKGEFRLPLPKPNMADE
ncbi:MAG: hypothetical protein AAFQ98_11995, partial [Bacteroidota bacterium]